MTPEELERLARRVYHSARNRAVAPEDAFSLAAELLDLYPLRDDARQLAELSLSAEDPARLTEATLSILGECLDLRFDEEPGLLEAVEAALDVVNADMRATGLPGTGRVFFLPEYQNAWVEVWDRYRGSGSGIFPSSGLDPLSALVAVADDAQDAVMHAIWGAWPVCPAHAVGVHAEAHDGVAVWWCKAGGGHAAAQIGQWDPVRLAKR